MIYIVAKNNYSFGTKQQSITRYWTVSHFCCKNIQIQVNYCYKMLKRFFIQKNFDQYCFYALVCSSVRIQIHGLSGQLLLQFLSYSFNILQDVYTHNGGVHVNRMLIFIKYSQNDRQLDLVIVFVCPDIDTWFVWLSPPKVLELQL